MAGMPSVSRRSERWLNSVTCPKCLDRLGVH